MKILILDIETSPSLAYVWGMRDQNISPVQLQEATDVLCMAWKWYGEKQISWSENSDDWYEALNEADVVVTYNGSRFDIPHLNRVFLREGKFPPAGYQHIDLFQTVSRKFQFPTSKLEYVAKELGLSQKIKNSGFDLWIKYLAGDGKAVTEMARYNRQDVKVTEELYERLRPWISNHPSRSLYEDLDGCPTCGSERLQRRGYSYTKVSKYQRWHCQDCGSWSRSKKRDAGAEERAI